MFSNKMLCTLALFMFEPARFKPSKVEQARHLYDNVVRTADAVVCPRGSALPHVGTRPCRQPAQHIATRRLRSYGALMSCSC